MDELFMKSKLPSKVDHDFTNRLLIGMRKKFYLESKIVKKYKRPSNKLGNWHGDVDEYDY